MLDGLHLDALFDQKFIVLNLQLRSHGKSALYAEFVLGNLERNFCLMDYVIPRVLND